MEQQFTDFIVVPLSSHEIDGVRKEQERLTAARNFHLDAAVNMVYKQDRNSRH